MCHWKRDRTRGQMHVSMFFPDQYLDSTYEIDLRGCMPRDTVFNFRY